MIYANLEDFIYLEIPKKYSQGTLTKRSYKTTANKYDLRIPEGEDELVIKDVVSVFESHRDGDAAKSGQEIGIGVRLFLVPEEDAAFRAL